jgi:putative ABC transport system permease protein
MMRAFQFRNLVKTAYKSILKNRMRSFLTSLGIIIGVAAVIVMVGIGEGAQQQIRQQLASLGTDVMMIFPGVSRYGGVSRGAGSWHPFTLSEVEKIRERATLLKALSPVVRSGAQVIGGGQNWSTSVFGVDPSYFTVRDWSVSSGEIFSDRDVITRRKVAVLGKTVADALFPGGNPVGERIRIRNVPFTVIGVLKSKGQSTMGQDQDDIIVAPTNTVMYRLQGEPHVDFLMASARSPEEVDQAREQVSGILREIRKLQPEDPDDFSIRTQAEIIETASATSKMLTLLLGSIAGVSLVVGGIGIMNIMLVSVTERTREIGIRLSLGARSIDVLTQFVSEAIVLSLTGGVIGIGLSFVVAFIVNRLSSLSMIISATVVVLVCAICIGVGVFFGFYPARKAASLNPVEALRYE